VLAALVAGASARALDLEAPDSAVTRLMALLRGVFEPQGIHVPDPLAVSSPPSASDVLHVSHWGPTIGSRGNSCSGDCTLTAVGSHGNSCSGDCTLTGTTDMVIGQ